MASPIQSARNAMARRRVRHTPSGFGCLLADSIDYVNPAAWDGVVGDGSVFLSRRYLSVVEKTGPENITPRYAMVFRGAEPVACVAAQSVSFEPGRFGKKGTEGSRLRKRDRLARIASKPFRDIEQRMLICGNLMSWGCHGVAVARGEDPREVYPAVAEALYRMRRADKLAGETDLVVVKDFTPGDASHAEPLRTFSYRRLDTDPNMVLELAPEWRSFDDYLAALNSKYRGEIRKVQKEVAAAGMVVDSAPITPAEGPELHGLYMQVHTNARVRLFTLGQGLLPALQSTFAGDFRCTRVRKGDRTVGFVTSLKDGDTCLGYYIGFDRAANDSVPIYFRLLQATIADALALGCRRVSLGRTALEPKARLGARPVPMHVWVRHRVPMMNLIVRAALKGVHHDEASQRDGMKAAAPAR
jgi:hypothetical protein